MGKKRPKRYSAQFKFNVVLEALMAEKAEAEVARTYGVHPVTLSRWKKQFLEQGSELFGGSEEVKAYEERIGQLELVGEHQNGHSLNACLRGSRGLEGELALPDAEWLEAGGARDQG